MKKKVIITIFIVLVLIMMFPIIKKDNENIEYRSLIYKIIKIKEKRIDKYDNGIIVMILNHVVYNGYNIATSDENIELQEPEDDNGILLIIERGDKKCIPVRLELYNNKTYKLYTHYKACKPFETCASITQYSSELTGSFDYDISKIIKNSRIYNNEKYPPKYILYSANGEKYIAGKNNNNIEDFFNSIDINMNKCAKKDY